MHCRSCKVVQKYEDQKFMLLVFTTTHLPEIREDVPENAKRMFTKPLFFDEADLICLRFDGDDKNKGLELYNGIKKRVSTDHLIQSIKIFYLTNDFFTSFSNAATFRKQIQYRHNAVDSQCLKVRPSKTAQSE